MTTTPEAPPIRVTTKVGATMFGLSELKIRRACYRGLIPGAEKLGDAQQSQWSIPVDGLRAWADILPVRRIA